jgi:Zn-finger nucleic acid-binding protein
MEQQQNLKKICKQCGVEFVEKKFGTFEHKYCSKECRNNYNNTLRNDKFKQLEKQFLDAQEPQPKQERSSDNSNNQNWNGNTSGHHEQKISFLGGRSYDNISSNTIIERILETSISANKFELKCEWLTAQNEDLKREVRELKFKIEELEEEPEEKENVIGKLLENPTIQQAIPLLLAKLAM